jgi:hypothetical protein
MRKLENKTWIEKDIRNGGEQGENELAGHSPGVQGGGCRRQGRQGHHRHRHHDELPGEGGGGASWQLEGGIRDRDRDRARDAKRDRDERLPDTRSAEEGSVDHQPGRVVHQHGHGGDGAGARGGAVQTWNEKSKLIINNDVGKKTERGPPQATDTDRSSSSLTTFPPICSEEGRQVEEEGRCQVRKKEIEMEERRQESGRRSGFIDKFQSTNTNITRLSKRITYRGGGETETARGSRKPSCGSSSSSSASPQDPQSPASSSTLVEQATRSPLIDRRSPSPVELMAGRTMSAEECRNTFSNFGRYKDDRSGRAVRGEQHIGGKMQ